jgi:hypothetical protein
MCISFNENKGKIAPNPHSLKDQTYEQNKSRITMVPKACPRPLRNIAHFGFQSNFVKKWAVFNPILSKMGCLSPGNYINKPV